MGFVSSTVNMKYNSAVLLPFYFIGVQLYNLGTGIIDDCGDDHMMCSNDLTCCELESTCCPRSSAPNGVGCCEIINATCCADWCCFEGFTCQPGGGCAVSSSSKNSSLGHDFAPLWVPGIPIEDGSTWPPVWWSCCVMKIAINKQSW